MIDWMKLFITIMIFIFTIWVYGYYVNVSSTKWFVLRQEMNKLKEAKFSHNIVQFEIMALEKQIRENMQEQQQNFNQRKITINNRVEYVTVMKAMAKK